MGSWDTRQIVEAAELHHADPTMTTPEHNILRRLDLGVAPDAGVSGPILLQSDYRTILTFNASSSIRAVIEFGAS